VHAFHSRAKARFTFPEDQEHAVRAFRIKAQDDSGPRIEPLPLAEDRTGEGHIERTRGVTHVGLLILKTEDLW
jgi:hypothetical protein